MSLLQLAKCHEWLLWRVWKNPFVLMLGIQIRTTYTLELMALVVTGSRVQGNGLFSRHKKSIEVEKNADLPPRTAVKTIQSEDGDVIECIDIYKQPAFDHPALRNHKIQMVPTYNPTEEIPVEYEEGDFRSRVTTQVWKKTGSCPDGTIPIRKMQRKNVYKASSTDNYHMRKRPPYFHLHNRTEEKKDVKLLQMNHSLAILHTEGYAYYGGKGAIQVWNPWVELDDEYSTSQVALKSGPHNDYESMESGWAVNPSVYGDRQTRLFVYWTVDGSRETGCFDLTCPGFVQTSSEVTLGAAIYPISSPRGLPHEITIFIHKDPNTSNWWLQYQERINIGYWPGEIFSSLRYHAVTVQWGGEVYSTRVGVHPHTATAMGSGSYADFIFHRSGVVRRMRVLVGSLVLKFPDYVNAYADEYECYDTWYLTAYIEDPEFYYGGPGRNWRCP